MTIEASWTLFLASIIFTLLHAADEFFNEGGPLWENFGEIVGTRLPYRLGFALFSVGLPCLLILAAFFAYLYQSPFALSVMVGARLGDTVISHWWLWLTGLSSPNPGLQTTPLYVLEAAAVLFLFGVSWPGVLVGAGFFLAVLPVLRLSRRIFPDFYFNFRR